MSDITPVPELSPDQVTTLLSSAPFGMLVVGGDGRVIASNDGATDLLGLTGPGTVAHLADLLADSGDSPLLEDLLRSAMAGAHARRVFRINAGGVLRVVSMQCWPQDTADGRIVLTMVEAASGDDRAEQLSSVIARSPTGMARVGNGTTMLDVNDRWEEITGQPRGDALGDGWFAQIDVDGRADFVAALADASARSEGIRGRLRVITTAGAVRWLDISSTPLDEPGAALLSFEDMTEGQDAARRADELSRVLEATKDMVGILSPDGGVLVWTNDSLHDQLGDSSVAVPFVQHLDEFSQAAYVATGLPAVLESGRWRGELVFVQNGVRTPVAAMLVTHQDSAGDVEAISIVARDVSDLRDAKAQVTAAEVRMRALVEHASDVVAMVGSDGRVEYASPAVERVLGHTSGALRGLDILELVHPDDLDLAYETAAAILETEGESRSARLRIAHVDGTFRHLEVVANNLLATPEVAGIVLNATDVTDRVEAAQQLEARTYHDELTGLPNRTLLIERLRESLRRCRERRLLVGVLFLDLDRFNVVNESLGHRAGDELLAEVASRIEGVIRPGDVVARLGGDEFAVVISDMLRQGDAVVAARRLRKALTEPVRIGDQTAVITTSIGIAITNGQDEPESLLRDADTALHRAKQKGRDVAVVFDDNLRDQAIRRLEVENKLRRAIENDALVVHYQPVLSVRDGRLAGAEALVRIRNDDGTLVMPGDFIDVAEDSGLIAQLGHQVLVKAIRQTAAWTREHVPGQDPLSIAVNVSARQLTDERYPDELVAVLNEAGLAPSQLSVELTESALIDGNPTTERSLQQLRDAGVRIGLDDFGTGFSSLAYLKRFPISFLKIDKSFVNGLGSDENDSAIVRATIALAHSLNLRVVAEGVETEDQLDRLADLQCDLVQGYLFSKPVGPEAFRAYLGMRWSS